MSRKWIFNSSDDEEDEVKKEVISSDDEEEEDEEEVLTSDDEDEEEVVGLEIFLDEDEKEEQRFERLKARYNRWEIKGDSLKREIKESVFRQAKKFENLLQEKNELIDELKQEKSKLIGDLKASMKELRKARRENLSCKKQILDREEKVKFLNSEIEVLEIGKNMVADELEASREEVDRLDKASRDLERKTIRATRSDKEYNKKLETAVKAERRKFVAELDALKEEVKRLNKALEHLNFEKELWKKQNVDLGKAYEKLKLDFLDLKRQKEEEKSNKNSEEEKNARLSARLQNDAVRKLVEVARDEIKKSQERLEKLVEVQLEAKNDKDERTLKDVGWKDWTVLDA